MSGELRAIATDAPEINANDLIMAKNMADTLHRHYPGHLWGVTCEGRTGIATIRNLALSGKWGFIIKLKAQYSASEMERNVIRGGGELLERYRMSRGRLNIDQYSNLKTDFSGHFKADR